MPPPNSVACRHYNRKIPQNGPFLLKIIQTLFHRTLKNTLNDFEFESLNFVDYVQPTFASLFTLLKEVKECETKMSVLNVMSVCVEKMGDKLYDDAESLCQYLPILWHESAEHNLLRCAVLSALVSFPQFLKTIKNYLPRRILLNKEQFFSDF